MLGLMPTRDALRMASEMDLDLVEITANVNPPVCKIIDFGKFNYEKQKKGSVHVKKDKEIQVSLNIDEHDLKIKMTHAFEFLDKKHNVRFTLKMRGRELQRANDGLAKMNMICDMMHEKAKIVEKPKLLGKKITMLFAKL